MTTTNAPAAIDADEARKALELGVRFVTDTDLDWPEQLNDLGTNAPDVLRVWGNRSLRELATASVTITGSRAATSYGTEVAEELGRAAARAGYTVITGGAYGIEAAALRGALAEDGATIIVSAAGADLTMPAHNAPLFEATRKTGLILSAYPLGGHPTRARFLERNDVLGALGRGVILVEASSRSGALRTAGSAFSIGTPVMAVPGPITNLGSRGTNSLIRRARAELVTNFDDVLNTIERHDHLAMWQEANRRDRVSVEARSAPSDY